MSFESAVPGDRNDVVDIYILNLLRGAVLSLASFFAFIIDAMTGEGISGMRRAQKKRAHFGALTKYSLIF